jgi:hypothetical protein
MTTEAIESATADDSNPYAASARIAAAMASLDGDEETEAATGQAATASTLGGDTATAGQDAQEEADPFDPAELRRLANERAQERQAATGDKQEQVQAAAPPPGVDYDRLAEAINRPTTEREAIEHLKRSGDITALAKVLGEDPGTLTEKILQQGVEPGSVRMQAELEATKRELAELKAAIMGDKREVVTREEMEAQIEQVYLEQRQKAYSAQLTDSYRKVGSDAARYPLQANLAEDLRMKYALEAEALLVKARGPDAFGITAEDIAEVTERELRRLAQTLGGASTHAAGTQSAAGRSSATHANTRGVGTLSNANASETVGAPANPYDMAARRKAALEALDE